MSLLPQETRKSIFELASGPEYRHDNGKFNYNKIARKAGCSVGAVKSYLKRGQEEVFKEIYSENLSKFFDKIEYDIWEAKMKKDEEERIALRNFKLLMNNVDAIGKRSLKEYVKKENRVLRSFKLLMDRADVIEEEWLLYDKDPHKMLDKIIGRRIVDPESLFHNCELVRSFLE